MISQAPATFWLSLLLTAIVLTGCIASQTPESLPPTELSTVASQTPESLPPTELSPAVNGTNQVLLIYEWPQDGFPTDPTKITAIALEKNILKIQVVYQGGCQEHTFALHAETAFLQSNPPQGSLYLSHDSHGDTCTENMEKSLSFDLTPLNQERDDPSERPLLLRVLEPVGGSFANEPFMPLIEWP